MGGGSCETGISLVTWLITTAAGWPVLSKEMTPPRGARAVGARRCHVYESREGGRKYIGVEEVWVVVPPVLCHR